MSSPAWIKASLSVSPGLISKGSLSDISWSSGRAENWLLHVEKLRPLEGVEDASKIDIITRNDRRVNKRKPQCNYDLYTKIEKIFFFKERRMLAGRRIAASKNHS